MDEWASLEQLDLATVDTGDVEVIGPDGKKKKRAGGTGADEHDEEHAEFDPHALREHEEFTKVKNVERIELGRWEMETWYFSPLPPEFNDCKKLYFAEFDLTVREFRGFSKRRRSESERAQARVESGKRRSKSLFLSSLPLSPPTTTTTTNNNNNKK